MTFPDSEYTLPKNNHQTPGHFQQLNHPGLLVYNYNFIDFAQAVLAQHTNIYTQHSPTFD